MTVHSAIAADLPIDRSRAFQRVLEDESAGAYRMACAVRRNRDEAQDALQEALVKAWHHWPSLRQQQ